MLACLTDDECPAGACKSGACGVARCDDARRNGTETGVDCGGNCTPCGAGEYCSDDADCSSNACDAGRCCGGTLADCTRCAQRLAGNNTCALADAEETACNAFLQCLADNIEQCPRRLAPGCSNEPGSVCDVRTFGGNGSTPIRRADSILGTARCAF